MTKTAFLKYTFCFWLVNPLFIRAQNLYTDTASFSSALNSVTQYQKLINEQLNIYHGIAYQPYPNAINSGYVFFTSPVALKSTINYYGITYYNIDALYDLVTDKLIVKYVDGFSEIELFKDGVKDFSIAHHHFIWIDKSAANNLPVSGFYDLLQQGKISLFAKRKKKIEESVNSSVKHDISESVSYYILSDNIYYEIDSKNSLVKTLKDLNIQDYIRSNNLDIKKDMENTLIKTVSFYNKSAL